MVRRRLLVNAPSRGSSHQPGQAPTNDSGLVRATRQHLAPALPTPPKARRSLRPDAMPLSDSERDPLAREPLASRVRHQSAEGARLMLRARRARLCACIFFVCSLVVTLAACGEVRVEIGSVPDGGVIRAQRGEDSDGDSQGRDGGVAVLLDATSEGHVADAALGTPSTDAGQDGEAAPLTTCSIGDAPRPLEAIAGDAGLASVHKPELFAGRDSHLLLWMDQQRCFNAPYCTELLASRVSFSGAMLEPVGINVAEVRGPLFQTSVQRYMSSKSAAFDGSNFLIVWTEVSTGGSTALHGRTLGRRVSSSGDVIDAVPITIADSVGLSAAEARVGFDGANFLVSWLENPDGEGFATGTIKARRVATSGSVLDPTGITVSDASKESFSPNVSCGGGDCILIWPSYGPAPAMRTARVTNGVVTPAGGRVLAGVTPTYTQPSTNSRPNIAYDGVHHLAVWTGSAVVKAAFLDRNGELLAPGGFDFASAQSSSGAYFIQMPDVVWDGSEFRVSWGDNPSSVEGSKSIYGATIAYGASSSARTLLSAEYAFSPATAACRDAACVMAIQHEPFSAPRDCLFISRWAKAPAMSLDSTTMGPTGAGDRTIRSAAFGGGRALLSWMEAPPSLSNATTLPVAMAGFVDGDGFAQQRLELPFTGPSAYAGGTFLVAGAVASAGAVPDLAFFKIDPTGSISATSPLATGSRDVDVASDGDQFLAAWLKLRTTGEQDLVASRISATGQIIDATPIIVEAATARKGRPRVAFDGTNFLVAWSNGELSRRVLGARITRTGVLLDLEPFHISEVRSEPIQLSVAGSPAGGFLVLWEDGLSAILGNRVSAGGMPLDAAGVVVAAGDHVSSLQTLWDSGSRTYIGAWADADGDANRIRFAPIALPVLPNVLTADRGVGVVGAPLLARGVNGIYLPYLVHDSAIHAKKVVSRLLTCN